MDKGKKEAKKPAAKAPAKKPAAPKKEAATKAAPKKPVATTTERKRVAPVAKGDNKKQKAAPQKKKVGAKKDTPWHREKRPNPLIRARPKNFRIGGDIPPKRDLTRFVRWPWYIRLQRQKRILFNRLKVPPPINQFSMVLSHASACHLFRLLNKIRPEEKAAKKRRRMELAKKVAAARKKTQQKKAEIKKQKLAEGKQKEGAKKEEKPATENDKAAAAEKKPAEKKPAEKKPAEKKPVATKAAASKSAESVVVTEKPIVVKYGLNHVTKLVEKNKAQLVVIASDVDPIELVVWLPTLCRKKKVPYCIVKNKARLGRVVHKKTSAVLAVTAVPKEDRPSFNKLIDACKVEFNDNGNVVKTWGKQTLGIKRRQLLAKRARILRHEEARKSKGQK